jgi:hypothetical protein
MLPRGLHLVLLVGEENFSGLRRRRRRRRRRRNATGDAASQK